VTLEAVSSVYETEPVGEIPDQRDFYNAAARVETTLDTVALLDACKRIEHDLGRRPGLRHGPRPIDVDLLLVGDEVLETERLRLPHPEVTARRFVLVPLLELDPDLELPAWGPLRAALEQLPEGQRVRPVGQLLAQG
jgi:2-amino-4-hydroxy-6-hydroxymethyldihydropteridine diphosphokinase